MSTHDYIISNGTGAAVRSDLNNALAAIVSNNSNSSEPATKYAYQWWADTSNAVMKIRNSANDGWIELFQLDGTITLEDGSASTPALAFRDDLNTGIFSSAADTFNVATAGVERMELGATTVFNEDGADVDFRIEGDTQENLFYVDAGNERIGINTSSPSKTFEMSGAGEPQFCIRSDRTGGTENMGSLFFRSQSTDIARIQVQVDGTIKFKNTSNLDQAMTIDTNHNVVVGATTAQASDSATLMADGEVTAAGFYFTNNIGSAMNTEGIRRATTNTIVFDISSSEAMRLNGSGLGVGITPTCGLHVDNPSNSAITQILDTDNTAVKLVFRNSTVTSNEVQIGADGSSLVLVTGSETRTSIGSLGNLYVRSADTSNASQTLKKTVSGADTIDYLQCRDSSNTAKAIIAGDGDLTNANNSYGQISDSKIKENIVDANSQWDDVKAVKVRNFNFKESSGLPTHKQIGVVAQELETVSAGLVSESIDRDPDTNEDLGTKTKSVKYSVLYMKSFKALQEAIAKIEVLETKVAALEAA